MEGKWWRRSMTDDFGGWRTLTGPSLDAFLGNEVLEVFNFNWTTTEVSDSAMTFVVLAFVQRVTQLSHYGKLCSSERDQATLS